MIFCDASPLVAIIDRDDARHADCHAALPLLSTPLITTWACLTEAMHIVGRKYGFQGQAVLWSLLERNIVAIHSHNATDWQRMHHLMQQYQNVPMDLADASLVAAAESLNLTRIFTLDADFRIYRIKDKIPFEIVP